ncbi:histidyl-tRNA synthetase isoform B [Chlorella sorokiniana]|uniref:Histidine--tRNA ligase, cytoplasmic n=1 Tax=Chlorella sorokiniana TaxID=3076 RepID=A0A2P6U0Q6_CHLSO|nr:histidyl-tRNA synthetase isoform B [Chlorella sorokiniana]|eukprot:PRW59901.1 histidyl-tRNA synthetase isoform B [Chlorella sorokiniana]
MVQQHAVICGGAGATATLDQVVAVAGGAHVALDSAALGRLKKESPAPKAFQAEEPAAAAAASAAALEWPQARAALFYKLLALVNGRSGVRPVVAEAIAALLNAGGAPRLPAADSDAPALAALAALLQGVGAAEAADGSQLSAADALAAAGVEAPGLSAAERAVLSDGQGAAAGTAALCVQAGKLLLASANAVAALAAEALQADVKALDTEAVEACPHKGAIEAADEIRGLLDGSRQVNAKKAGVGSLPAISNAAQVHGSLLEALNAAAGPAKAELAVAALPPTKDGAPQQAGSPSLASALLLLATATLKAAGISLKRSAAIAERLPTVAAAAVVAGGDAAAGAAGAPAAAAALQQLVGGAAAAVEAGKRQAAEVAGKLALAGEEEAVPSLAAAQAAYAAHKALQQAVAVEALAAATSLRVQEGAPAAPAEPVAAPAAPAEGGKKKDKKKDKGGPAGMLLGKGTALLRDYVENVAAGGSGATAEEDVLEHRLQRLSLADGSADLAAALPAVAAALDPLGHQWQLHLAALRGVIEANQARRKPKIAKGARDMMPDQMAIREVAFDKITRVFKRHGAVSIDTPVFELRETLMGKYGEDSKLIYDLADQGGEILSLRYDLTVPFARFVALHGVGNIKRYHIAKVYRRDQPQMARGRFREFFQCDFDIAGSYPTMVPDAEVLKVLVEILDDLQLGAYEVKLNHRRLLDAMLDIAGVPPQKFRPICSAIDKLDKEPWEAVRAEMVEEKGLPGHVADRIGEFVVLRGQPQQLLATLTEASHPLAQHAESAAALEELRTLFGFLEAMGALGPIVFDLSLARGLDYYTGVIYEAVLQGANVGSIAAGGRYDKLVGMYDKLVGMFSGKEVPAVGVSIGIERVFAIMEAQLRAQAEAAGGTIRETETEVLVASIGGGMQPRRMRLAAQLWAAGIRAEFGYKANPKMPDQLGYALKQGIPYLVLFGESEVEAGVVKIKDLDANTEETVPEGEVIARLQQLLPSKAGRRIVYQQKEDGASA